MSLIFVVPHNHFYLPTGFLPFDARLYRALLSNAFFHERRKCEHDPDYLQLVTYAVIEDLSTGKMFVYQRSAEGDEARLHAKYSIGVGGHVDFSDNGYGDSADQIVEHSLRRELHEELGLDVKAVPSPIGFLYDDTTAEGREHLGIVYRIAVTDMAFAGEIAVLVDRRVLSLSEVADRYDRLETWSQLLIQRFVPECQADWWVVRGIRRELGTHVQSPRWMHEDFEDDRCFRRKEDAFERPETLKQQHSFDVVRVAPRKNA